MPYLDLPDCKLYYRIDDHTDAWTRPEPVVFVHGLGGQWQNWLENLPRRAQNRRVVAMDLPGFGLTPEPEDDEKSTITRYGR